MDDPSILVLGVGNTLMRDDGIGVWAVKALADVYEIPPNILVMDGGIAGLRLLGEFARVSHLLIVDAIRGGGAPGSIYRLEPEALPGSRGPFLSAHEVGIAELLSAAEFSEKLPKTRIIGVEPLQTEAMGLELTEPLRAVLPTIVLAVVEELNRMGFSLRKKPEANKRKGEAKRIDARVVHRA